MQRQVDFGSYFDNETKKWAEEKSKADAEERLIKSISTDEEWRHFQEKRTDHGFQVIMDNVDLVIHPRHTSREKHGSDLHMAHAIAVKNRVEGYHLPNDAPISTVSSINVEDFLPTLSDNKTLKHEWMLLIGNIISSHIPALKWISGHVPAQPHHDHMSDMCKKSHIVRAFLLD